MPCVEANEAQSSSVWARDESEVKFRSRLHPLAAKLCAIASPIPIREGDCVNRDVSVALIVLVGLTPRSTGDNAELALQRATLSDHVELN